MNNYQIALLRLEVQALRERAKRTGLNEHVGPELVEAYTTYVVFEHDDEDLLRLSRAHIPFISDAARKAYTDRTDTVEVRGRAYDILGKFEYTAFSTRAECRAAVNEYLAEYPNEVVVLDDEKEGILMVDVDDAGINLYAEDREAGDKT